MTIKALHQERDHGMTRDHAASPAQLFGDDSAPRMHGTPASAGHGTPVDRAPAGGSGFYAAINAGLVPPSMYGGGAPERAPHAPTTSAPPSTRATAADFHVSAWDATTNRPPVRVGSPSGDRMTIGVQADGIGANATVRAVSAAAQGYSVGYVQTIHHSDRRAIYVDGEGTVLNRWVATRGMML